MNKEIKSFLAFLLITASISVTNLHGDRGKTRIMAIKEYLAKEASDTNFITIQRLINDLTDSDISFDLNTPSQGKTLLDIVVDKESQATTPAFKAQYSKLRASLINMGALRGSLTEKL